MPSAASDARQAFMTCASWNVRRTVSPIRPMPCESELTIWIAPSSWSGPSAAIVAGVDALADQRDVLGDADDAPWLSTVIGTCSAAV